MHAFFPRKIRFNTITFSLADDPIEIRNDETQNVMQRSLIFNDTVIRKS